MAQCLGRLVRDTPKGVNMLSFEGGALFHLPLRCETMTRSGDLCDSCCAKEKKTLEKVRDISGTTIGGTHPSYLMGRVTDPIPFWCRLYDGAWFRLKLESGSIISAENMAKIKKAVEKAYEGVETVEPQPMPGKKSAAKKAAKPALEQSRIEEFPASAIVEAPPAPPAPVPKKRAAVKKSVAAPSPVANIGTSPVDCSDDTVIHIKVRKQEVDGRMFYLDPRKDKLYDMKFKYVGRLKDGANVDYPDSDADH